MRLILLLIFFCPQVLLAQNLYPFNENNKWGFVNEKSEFVIKPVYDYVNPFISNVAAAEKNGLWGFIDATGKPITRFSYIDLMETSENLIAVSNQEGKWGYIDLQGKTVIEFNYDDAYPFSHGLAPVKKNGLYGFINKEGKVVIKHQFTDVSSFNKDGFSHVFISLNDAFIIDTLGKKHEYLGDRTDNLPNNGIYCKHSDGGYGFYDVKTRKLIIPHQYSNAYYFNDGLAPVEKNGKWGYIDKTNKLIIPYQFDDANPFSEGMAAVKVGNKKGYIDTKGNFAIKPTFESAGNFKNNVAEIVINDRDGYVNKSGKILMK